MKRKKRTRIVCEQCFTTADLKDNPKAWNGWQIAPGCVCPACIDKSPQMQEPGPPPRSKSIMLST